MIKSNVESMGNFLSEHYGDTPKVMERVNALKSRYNEPWRHYHTLQHPLALFDILTTNIKGIKDPRVIGWTILYHDAVYDPTATSGRNEELSALLAEHELPELIGQDKANLVAMYTRSTANHDADLHDPDLDFFLDADLAILGSSQEDYDEYARNIRLEYAHVPEETYRQGRISILNRLSIRSEKTGLYITDLFKSTHEQQAQENIAREISSLVI